MRTQIVFIFIFSRTHNHIHFTINRRKKKPNTRLLTPTQNRSKFLAVVHARSCIDLWWRAAHITFRSRFICFKCTRAQLLAPFLSVHNIHFQMGFIVICASYAPLYVYTIEKYPSTCYMVSDKIIRFYCIHCHSRTVQYSIQYNISYIVDWKNTKYIFFML